MNDVGCLWAGRPDRRAVIEQTEESTNPRQTADEPVRPVFDPNLVDLPHGQAHESVEPQNLFGRSCYLEKRDTVFVQHIAHLGGVDVAVRRLLKHGIHAFMGDIETILDRQHVVLSAVPIDDQLRIPRIVFVGKLGRGVSEKTRHVVFAIEIVFAKQAT